MTIELPAKLQESIQHQTAGKDVDQFVLEAIEEKLARSRSLDAVCAPFVRAVEASGMKDDEFAAVIEQARQERWAEKHEQGNASGL
jgi:hypothetical protein